MKPLFLLLLAVAAYGEQLEGLLNAMPKDLLAGLENESKMTKSESSGKDALKLFEGTDMFSSKGAPFSSKGAPFSSKGAPFSSKGVPIPSKVLKTVPIKKIAVKKAVAAKTVAAKAVAAKAVSVPKLKAAAVMKSKPKVHYMKPIVHVIEKPVPVYHKVPFPKKVLVPKFYPVIKKIPVPKIVPVPFKVPIKKIIPKIVKIPKAIPIPKIVPVKKLIPVAIPYPVPKYKKFPIYKPVPYKKYIPIPIPKKVPKFIPFPVKKIIKVPKPYYVPIKVPKFSASYVKTPMAVNVPNIKKFSSKDGNIKKFSSKDGNIKKFSSKDGNIKKFSSKDGNIKKFSSKEKSDDKAPMDVKSDLSQEEAKFLESILGNLKEQGPEFGESIANLGSEDQELMKLLAGNMAVTGEGTSEVSTVISASKISIVEDSDLTEVYDKIQYNISEARESTTTATLAALPTGDSLNESLAMKSMLASPGLVFVSVSTIETKSSEFSCPLRSGLYPSPKSCRKFYHCSNWIPYHKICPSNLHFNPMLRVCDWPYRAGCHKI